MRFIHTADWHLGKSFHEYPLQEDQEHFVTWFVEYCHRSEPDFVLIAGDIFDRGIPPEWAVGLWNRFLDSFVQKCPGLPLLLIAGNHDSGTRLSLGSGLFRRAGIHVAGRFSAGGSGAAGSGAAGDWGENLVELETRKGQKAQVWLVPFLWAGDLAALDGSGQWKTLGSQAACLTEALSRIKNNQTPGVAQILVSHCFAQGAQESESERVLVGQATQVGVDLFDSFHYTALGHLHRPQTLDRENRVHYAGSPLAYSFSESLDQKSVVLAELDAEAGDWSVVIHREPIPVLRPVKVWRGPAAQLEGLEDKSEWKDAYLKVEDTQPGALANPFHRLKQFYPWLMDYREWSPGTLVEGRPQGAESLAKEREPGRRSLVEDFQDFLTEVQPGSRNREEGGAAADSLGPESLGTESLGTESLPLVQRFAQLTAQWEEQKSRETKAEGALPPIKEIAP